MKAREWFFLNCKPYVKSAPLGNPTMYAALVVPALLVLIATLFMLDNSSGFILAAFPALVAKRNELSEKQTVLAKIFEEAGESMNMDNVKSIDGTSVAKVEKIRLMNDELNALGVEVEKLAGVEKAALDQKNREGMIKGQPSIIHPDSKGTAQPEAKTLGQHVTQSPEYKKWLADKHGEFNMSLDIYPSDLKAAERKTLFETAAGWAPESTRMGKLVDYATRPIELLDLIPTGQTGQAAVVYMEETTFTNSAAEIAEGGTFAESVFALTERSETVRKVTNSIPVTDEQLDDVAMVNSYLNNRLIFGLRQRLDYQILNGTGIAPYIKGLLYTGLQTQAKGADPVPDAIHKAITKVRHTGYANPNAVVLHPNDWQDIRLTRTTDGIYIWGSPSEAVSPRIWGLPVAVSSIITENTGLVGDFANYCMLFERSGIDVQIGYSGTQFVEGKRTMRASMRAALVRFRAYGFCTITSI